MKKGITEMHGGQEEESIVAVLCEATEAGGGGEVSGGDT